MTDCTRSRFRLPCWGWFQLATVVLVLTAVGVSISQMMKGRDDFKNHLIGTERELTRMSVRYESQSGQTAENPVDVDLDRLLGQLDGNGNSFASLTMPDGSYIQAGGGPDEFTVEIREVLKRGSFRHLKAGLKNGRTDERRLTIGGASVSVLENQVLELSTAQQLFRFFSRTRSPDPAFVWQDITPMFVN